MIPDTLNRNRAVSTEKMNDKVRDMDETGWWDFWNTSHRSVDNYDDNSSELFARTAAVVNEIAPQANANVLEVGCGTGTLSRLLACPSYHGLDISPAAIGIARETAEPTSVAKRSYEVADIHDWPVRAERFDVAVCVDAVAYFRDQQFALTKIAQSLRPAGKFVLTTINPYVYHRIRRGASSPLREGSVSRWLCRHELHELMQASGFTIERSWTIMPRGNRGILRVINARRINQAFGPRGAAVLKTWKENVGLGQYRVVVARKRD